MTAPDGPEARDLEWLVSAGGPLILVPDRGLTAWRGCGPDADFTDGSPETWGDYGRACAAKSDSGSHVVATIPVGDTQALVLGEPGAPTAFLPERQLFVQYAPDGSEAEFLAGLDATLAAVTWTDELTWTTPGPAMLFDSVCASDEIEQWLRVETQPGAHLVQVADTGHIFIRLAPV